MTPDRPDQDLAAAMQGVAEATQLVVAVECHPEERFWRRWWARIDEEPYVRNRRPLAALTSAFGRHLASHPQA